MQVSREDTAVLYVSAPDELAGIQRAWRQLEELVPLRGRRFLGVVWPEGVYWAAVERLPGEDRGALEEGVVPGGAFARTRLRGEPPAVYDEIAPAYEALEAAGRDPDRPGIEYYRRRDEIDVLVPI